MNEEWRAVVGFEGSYEVSDQGRVRSLDRLVKWKLATGTIFDRMCKGQMLCLGTVKSGHQIVFLGHRKHALVHALVLTAFVGERPEGFDSCHNDGDPANNKLTNLRWDTRSNNILDDFHSGVRKRGSVSHGTVPGNSYARRTAI